jgi:hypothetical protein
MALVYMNFSNSKAKNQKMNRRRSVGEKLEAFYLALLTAQGVNNEENIYRLAYTLNELESHSVNELDGETPEVHQDILKDARRKASQLIRSPYIETINQLIVSARKRLRAKTALDTETNIQHGQRHVHIFIELLGSWSNIVAEIMNIKLSKEMTQLILAQLHQRIIEMAFECFQVFKTDKDVDNWCIKAFQIPNAKNRYDLINLNALDNLVSQISAMRQIINQHYLFLFNLFSSFFSSETDQEPVEGQEIKVYSFLEQLLIVSKEEIIKWKEIDAIYSALENAYLQQSVLEACLQIHLISLEEKTFLLESFEDSIFLFHKILERTIQTNEEKNLFMISQKILELLQFHLPLPMDLLTVAGKSISKRNAETQRKLQELIINLDNYEFHDEKDEEISGRSSWIPTNSILANFLMTKKLFLNITRKEKIYFEKLMKKLLVKCTGRDYLLLDEGHAEHSTADDSLLPKQPPNSLINSVEKAPNSRDGGKLISSAPNSQKEFQTPLKTTGSSASSNTLVSNILENGPGSNLKEAWNEIATTGSVKGVVNQWIGGWVGAASPFLGSNNDLEQSSSPPHQQQQQLSKKSSHQNMPSTPANATAAELLLKALDLHDEDDDVGRSASSDIHESPGETTTTTEPIYSRLPESDLMVYYNCLMLLIRGMITLRVYLLENGLSVLSVDQIMKQSQSSSSSSQDSHLHQSVWLVMKVSFFFHFKFFSFLYFMKRIFFFRSFLRFRIYLFYSVFF